MESLKNKQNYHQKWGCCMRIEDSIHLESVMILIRMPSRKRFKNIKQKLRELNGPLDKLPLTVMDLNTSL